MKKVFSVLLLTLMFSACKDSNKKNNITSQNSMNTNHNPLIAESTLPYGAPDFTKINNDHFREALLQGMDEKREIIENIANTTEAATFENTILALEKSGVLLDRVRNVFSALTGAHTNDTLQAVQEEMAPKFSELRDAIYLNDTLFQRVKTLYEKRESLNLDGESLRLLENYFEDFEIAGANLSPENKEILKSYNSRLATLSNTFNKTLLEANNAGAVIFTDKSDLEGLSDADLKSLEIKDGQGWKIALQNTTQQPLLQSLKKRETREKLFKAAWLRADGTAQDTKAVITEIAELRAKKGALL